MGIPPASVQGTNFIMPARERAGAPVGRAPGGGDPYGRPPYGGAGGGNGNGSSPFVTGPQGGLLMMPGIPGGAAGGGDGGGYNPGMSGLHLQVRRLWRMDWEGKGSGYCQCVFLWRVSANLHPQVP